MYSFAITMPSRMDRDNRLVSSAHWLFSLGAGEFGRVRSTLESVQLRDDLSGNRLGCIVVNVNNDITVLLVARGSLVVDIL